MDSTPNASYKKSIKAHHYFNCSLSNFWDIFQSVGLFFTLLESLARETLTQLAIESKEESAKKPYLFLQSNHIQYKIVKTFNSDYCIQEQWQCTFPSLEQPYFVSFDVYSISQELSYLIVESHFPSVLNEDERVNNNEQRMRNDELKKISINILLNKYLPTHSEVMVVEGDFSLALSLLIRKEICQTFIELNRNPLNLKTPVISQITSQMSDAHYSKLKIEYEDKDVHSSQIQVVKINHNEIYIILTHFFFNRTFFSIQEQYANLAKMFIGNLKKTIFELDSMNKSKMASSSNNV